jgi:simple sugar transport system substrate-binding protein
MHVVQAFVAVAIVVAILASARLASAADEDRPLRLVFITTCVEAQFFEPVKQGMRDAAKKMGVTCDFIGTHGVDLEAQAAMVPQAVADGYDGIALNLVHAEAFDKVVREAIDAGVPVVGFNTDDHATPNARLSCVNQQLFEAGQSLARRVAPYFPPSSHVLMTMHDEGVSSLQDRLRGLQDVLKQKDARWTVAITGNDAVKGADIVAEQLRKNPDIRIVLCTGQADTEAAGRAIESHFPDQGYWAAGFDLSPKTLELIKQGQIRCTVDQQPYVQGFYPVVQLTLLLRYGITPYDMDAGAAVIDRSNVDQVLDLTKKNLR